MLLMLGLPLAGGLLALVATPPGNEKISRWIAGIFSVATLLASLLFVPQIVGRPGEYFSVIDVPWLENLNVRCLMGMDGLSGIMAILTNVLVVLSVLCSWTAIAKRTREFYFLLLLLQVGILGTFLALDLILFYLFWELMLIPLYFMIGIFGSANRIYATMKFFLYTFAGSVLMLIAMLALYFQKLPTGQIVGTFALPDLLMVVGQIDPRAGFWIFLGFLVAFAIKIPLFPFHTWLPDAHTEAPTAGSVILAGVLLKTGVYGLMRFAIPLFPAAARQCAPTVIVLALIGIVYGALTAFAQKDMKRLIAYSSVSHMGFIVLGLFAFNQISITGSALQMVNHGISTGGLFLCVGYIYERRHTRLMSEFGGLATNLKVYATLTMIMVLSSVGLPGLNGFAGEFPILLGSAQVHLWWAAVAGLGVILGACYLLRMTLLTFFGKLDNEKNKTLKDLCPREAFTLIVLAIAALWIGLYPSSVTRSLEPSSKSIVAAVAVAQAPAVASAREPNRVKVAAVSAQAPAPVAVAAAPGR
jgi:NADH-quinone oxidoreductase subunit M